MAIDIMVKQIKVETVQVSKLNINTTTGVKADHTNVVKADITASYGMIHVIDKVVIPN